jgi:CheY-like chemotaxis protein
MPAPEDSKARILYVDDLKTNLVLFQATFEKDFEIILAESAKKALEIIRDQEIEVLVTDQRMPDMTGTELLEKVSLEYPEIRRFLLTAYTDFETVVDAVNKGQIHGYINKPIQADEVKLSIQNALEVYYLRKRNTEILEQLEKANRELLDLDELKSEIIRVISQEMRNPLNRIMGTLHLLKDKIESHELVEVVNILDSSVSMLEDFSSMTEQISILKTPGHELKKEAVSIKEVVEYGLIEARERMQDATPRFDLHHLAEGLQVQGDFHLLVSCMKNILSFGMAHTPMDQNMTIRTLFKDDAYICEVIDAGRNYSGQLFEALEKQFSDSRQKLNLNLGIELGLAQLIMEAHGGRVGFQKLDRGRGCVSMIF